MNKPPDAKDKPLVYVPQSEEGFVDDPAAENEPNKHVRLGRAETHIFSSYEGYEHSDKIDPYHEKKTRRRGADAPLCFIRTPQQYQQKSLHLSPVFLASGRKCLLLS